jgi:hypothetical protein
MWVLMSVCLVVELNFGLSGCRAEFSKSNVVQSLWFPIL